MFFNGIMRKYLPKAFYFERVKYFLKFDEYHVKFRLPFTGFLSEHSEGKYEVCAGVVKSEAMLFVSQLVMQFRFTLNTFENKLRNLFPRYRKLAYPAPVVV